MSLVSHSSHYLATRSQFLTFKQCSGGSHPPFSAKSCRGSDRKEFFPAGLAWCILLIPVSWSLILFGVNFQQPERRVCHSHFRETFFPRPWGDLVDVPDIRQRCHQPSQPILAHARGRMKASCRWANRGTGRAGSQLHPTYTHCSFNIFGANYFYKSFQVS